MSIKQRLTITVDPELVEAGSDAVSRGEAESVSAWVSEAMREKATRDRRLAAMSTAIADYEAEFGELTDEEMEAQRRADRRGATVVRGRTTRPKRTSGRTS